MVDCGQFHLRVLCPMNIPATTVNMSASVSGILLYVEITDKTACLILKKDTLAPNVFNVFMYTNANFLHHLKCCLLYSTNLMHSVQRQVRSSWQFHRMLSCGKISGNALDRQHSSSNKREIAAWVGGERYYQHRLVSTLHPFLMRKGMHISMGMRLYASKKYYNPALG